MRNPIDDFFNNPALRIQDVPGAEKLAFGVSQFPHNKSLKRIWDRVKKEQQAKLLLNSNNPFYENTPPATLRLPNPEGRIRLGMLDGGRWLSLTLLELTRGTLVLGPIGGGKSTWLAGRLPEIARAGGVGLVYDVKGEGDVVDKKTILNDKSLSVRIWRWDELRFNPLQNPGVPTWYWANCISSVLSAQWSLIASTTLLQELLSEWYEQPGAKTWEGLISRAENFKPSSRRSLEYQDVIVRNLKSYHYAFSNVFRVEESDLVEKMTQQKGCLHVILCNGLPTDCASFLAAMIVRRDMENRRVNPEARKNVIVHVLEDSMAMLKKESSFQEGEPVKIRPLEEILLLGRSLNIGIMVACQNASRLSDYFLNNAGTVVCAGGSYGEDARVLSELMNLSKTQKAFLQTMRPGQVLVFARSEYPLAVLGSFPFIE